MGQAVSHSFGDPPTYAYPYLWSWGGKEVESDGKTVVLNSKQTVESVKFMVGFWKDGYDEGALAWDDSSNNRAFLSGTCSCTLNGASIYLEAKRKPNTYLTEKAPRFGRTSCMRHYRGVPPGSSVITCRCRICF
jgi:multiple sugar transport system substrate-binding protein